MTNQTHGQQKLMEMEARYHDVLDDLQGLLQKHQMGGGDAIRVMACAMADILAEQQLPAEKLDEYATQIATIVRRLSDFDPADAPAQH